MDEFRLEDITLLVPYYLRYYVENVYDRVRKRSSSAAISTEGAAVRLYFTVTAHGIVSHKPGVYSDLPPKIDEDNYTAEHASANPSLYRAEVGFAYNIDNSTASSNLTAAVVPLEYSAIQRNITVTASNPDTHPYQTPFIPKSSVTHIPIATSPSSSSPTFSVPLLIDQWLMALGHAPITRGDISTGDSPYSSELQRVAVQLRDILLAYMLPLGRPHAALAYCRTFHLRLWAHAQDSEPILLDECSLSPAHMDVQLPGFTPHADGRLSAETSSQACSMYPDLRISTRVPVLLECNAWGYVLVAWEDGTHTHSPSAHEGAVTVPAGFYLLCVRPLGRIPPHWHALTSETEMPLHGHLLCCGVADLSEEPRRGASYTCRLPRGLGGCGVACAWGRSPHAHVNTSSRAWAVVACIDAPKFVPGDERLLAPDHTAELKPLPAEQPLWLARMWGGFSGLSATQCVTGDYLWSPERSALSPSTLAAHATPMPFAALQLPGGLPGQHMRVTGPSAATQMPDAVLCAVVVVPTMEAREALLGHIQNDSTGEYVCGWSHEQAVSALQGLSRAAVCMVEHRRRGWELPGGKVEMGEPVGKACSREFLEEIGDVEGGVSGLDACSWHCVLQYTIQQSDGPDTVARLREALNANVGAVHTKSVMFTALVTEDADVPKMRCLKNETVRAGVLPLMTIPAHAPLEVCCDLHSGSTREANRASANTFVNPTVCVGGKTSPLTQDQVWSVVVRQLQGIVANAYHTVEAKMKVIKEQ